MRRRELGAGLLLSASALLLTGLVAEAALRVAGYVPRRARGPRRVLSPDRRLALDCYDESRRSKLTIDLRERATRAHYQGAGLSGLDVVAASHPFAVEYRYNALGFRDAEVGPKPPGVLRVFVLGDSFTEGQGVRESDAYPRVLEALLNAAEPGRWEVRNGGRRGADFPRLYEHFEALVRLAPDLVVYGMLLNDADQSPEFRARQRYLDDWILDRRHLEDVDAATPPAPRSRLLALVADRLQTLLVGRETTHWYLEMYGEANREGWKRTQRYLRIMNRTLQRRGGAFLVAQWPLLVGLDGNYPFEGPTIAVGCFCDEAGIPRLDLLSVLRGRPEASLWVSPTDRHPNEVAHRLVAEALAPVVRDLVANALSVKRTFTRPQ